MAAIIYDKHFASVGEKEVIPWLPCDMRFPYNYRGRRISDFKSSVTSTLLFFFLLLLFYIGETEVTLTLP